MITFQGEHVFIPQRFAENLHLFKGASLQVFFTILLSADQRGRAQVSWNDLQDATGKGASAVQSALKTLIEIRVNDSPILLSYQLRMEGGTFGDLYFIVFPNPEDCAK